MHIRSTILDLDRFVHNLGTTGSKVAIPAYGQPISLRRRSIAADLSSVSSFRGGMRGSGNHWGEKE
eukprot:1382082-Amorphochlora_amoeboformis.AAC.4